MTNENPYVPPRAAVADMDDYSGEYRQAKLWSPRGRVGRLRYLAYLTGSYLVFGVASAAGSAIASLLHAPVFGLLVLSLMGIAVTVFAIFLLIKRSHDMNWSGWTVIFAFIPIVGLIWIFNGGSKGSNAYGPPPPPNSGGVVALAILLPAVFVIGILAAIAIPQYQSYVLRAGAAHGG